MFCEQVTGRFSDPGQAVPGSSPGSALAPEGTRHLSAETIGRSRRADVARSGVASVSIGDASSPRRAGPSLGFSRGFARPSPLKGRGIAAPKPTDVQGEPTKLALTSAFRREEISGRFSAPGRALKDFLRSPRLQRNVARTTPLTRPAPSSRMALHVYPGDRSPLSRSLVSPRTARLTRDKVLTSVVTAPLPTLPRCPA